MAKKKKKNKGRAKQRIKAISKAFGGNKELKKIARNALKITGKGENRTGRKVTKKEMKALAAAGATKDQLNIFRKQIKKSDKLKIGKKVDQRKEIKGVIRETQQDAGIFKNTVVIGQDVDGPGKRKNIYTEFVGSKKAPLTKKAKKYQEMYSGKTQESKDYLKSLKASALQRMTINPEKYGRGTGEPSFAEQYDAGKKSRRDMFTALRKPLTDQLASQSGSALNMFTDGAIDFKPERFKAFASAGSIGDQIKSKASSLGVSSNNRAATALGKINSGNKTDYSKKFKQQLSFV
jgi:hypothetical protein|tara:strand:- start:1190 stop:2065 length:876 start_codon:yes stop_codon:yes gene_type:complete